MKAKFKEGDTVYFRGDKDFEVPVKVLRVDEQERHVMYDVECLGGRLNGMSENWLVKKND